MSASVLVTGAGGFLGGHLVQRLAERGAEVHATTREEPVQSRHGVRWWVGDLRDHEFVRRMAEAVRPEVVVSLAGLVTGGRGLELVLPSLEHTLRTVVNVLVAVTQAGEPRRVVLVGSVEEPLCEAGEKSPRSPYAAAKGAAALYGRMFHRLYGLPVVLVRPAMVYGPGQADLSKLVPHTITSLLRGEAPAIHSGGRMADWVYVDDVVDGLLACCTADGLEGEEVELGSGELTSVRRIVELIDRIVDAEVSPEVAMGRGRPHECERPADTAAAARHLDWNAKVELEEGLRRTVAWYRDRPVGG